MQDKAQQILQSLHLNHETSIKEESVTTNSMRVEAGFTVVQQHMLPLPSQHCAFCNLQFSRTKDAFDIFFFLLVKDALPTVFLFHLKK